MSHNVCNVSEITATSGPSTSWSGSPCPPVSPSPPSCPPVSPSPPSCPTVSSGSHKSPVSGSCKTVSGSVMLHSSSMCLIFLDSSSFCISSFFITAESESDSSFSCLEISLRTLFSRSSSRLLMSLHRAVTLSASPDAFC
ncbi:hypothetical protein GDO78_014474 [Eleutherodactylus coqui]|uniref:Uncharacterized protein n=1 Tax=Eleutherodactylus coqui TaxID=57060 RepID=A0A8J6E705_ELECQ|nr:hypothetical protein GDO78_014474 [Eleutherodactylus coqui]